MNLITIPKEKVSTSMVKCLNDTKIVRNYAGKTYHYTAKISNYQCATNYEKKYFNVADFNDENGWDYLISTTFLNELQINEILEVKVNMKGSNKYSYQSLSFLVVVSNTQTNIQFAQFNSAFKAFKYMSENIT
jgi:hypothetical protein